MASPRKKGGAPRPPPKSKAIRIPLDFYQAIGGVLPAGYSRIGLIRALLRAYIYSDGSRAIECITLLQIQLDNYRPLIEQLGLVEGRLADIRAWVSIIESPTNSCSAQQILAALNDCRSKLDRLITGLK